LGGLTASDFRGNGKPASEVELKRERLYGLAKVSSEAELSKND
jgi:hypothetical protein